MQGNRELIWEIEELLAYTAPQRIIQHTKDLHFKWQDNLDNLSKGQLEVVLKRLRRASRKTEDDFEQEAESSELIQSMRASLANFQWLLMTTGTQKDEDDEQQLTGQEN